jgi:hypothetical protein
MAENKPTARIQKFIIVTIGANSYSGHVSACAFVPTAAVVNWVGGSPDASLSATAASTWIVNMNVIQDWENAGSLSNFLLKNEGQVAVLTYQPHSDGVFKVVSNITLVAPTIGGPVNAFNESAMTFGATKPVPTFPAAVV